MTGKTCAVLGFDTETTGTTMEAARIVTAAMVWRDRNGEVIRDRTWLVDPQVPIPPAAAAVHGITSTAGGQDPAEAAEEIAAELVRGGPVVVFNAQYDLTVLDYELRRYGLKPLGERYGSVWPILDPMILDWGLWPDRPGKRSLAALCDLYGCEPRSWHDAAEDARAVLDLWDRLCRAAPELAGCSVEHLAKFQRQAHRSWVGHVNARRIEHGQSADAIPGWPIAKVTNVEESEK
jgi:DNA polymerase-3 subunit epsilon